MAIRHIVFDIGNVLLNFDPEYACMDLIPDQAPEDVLPIDNVAANVEAPRARGWQAVQFINPDGLRCDLRPLEVIV